LINIMQDPNAPNMIGLLAHQHTRLLVLQL
jgi:hypothetical protein